MMGPNPTQDNARLQSQAVQTALMAAMTLMAAFIKQMSAQGAGCGADNGLQGMAGALGGVGGPAQVGGFGAPGQLGQKQVQTVSVLGRYEGQFGKSGITEEQMREKLKSKDTPPDLKSALQAVLDSKGDPNGLYARLDSAKNGKSDGKISSKDINKLQELPEVQAFSRQRAQSYKNNYLPSDAGSDPSKGGRPITENDAMRELYKYSDHLPGKHIGPDTFRDIVNGKADMKKCPPQVVAAAQYYLDHPDQWKKFGGEDGLAGKHELGNKVATHYQLTAKEDRAVKTLDENRDLFFADGNLKRGKLEELSKHKDPKIAEAATTLLTSQTLFGVLDNGKHGHKGNLWNAADDGQIGKGDLDKFKQVRDPTVAPEPKGHANNPHADPTAVQEMACGQMNQPDIKSKKGGGLRDFVSGLLGGLSKVFEVLTSVVSNTIGRIPGIGKLLSAPAEIVGGAISGGLNVAKTATDGGNVGKAAKDFGFDMMETSISATTGIVDPTGVASGMFAHGMRSLADPNTKFDPAQALNPL
ncbi:hypothetical protein M8A51_04705 [Schlegelella sp. S2-27]|uniref:Uncharacterized protein n=1 Tax=Caldimonas mangrovi TaxID=2944811 RepID=A0ABT0YJD5_9BURK|nr:HrpF/NolX family T3SS translocon protein [Caldimonas mangrovi]MCM5678830.1 hypothetical protein [Caldimonas mangrovi]